MIWIDFIFLGMLQTIELEKYMLPCLNKQWLGVECMGCGAQRALAALFKGEFLLAFHLYPAIYGLLLIGFFLIFNLFVKFRFDYHLKMILIFTTVFTVLISYFIKMNP